MGWALSSGQMATSVAHSYPALCCTRPVLGVLDKCDLVGGHTVKQAARESDGWFKFWLCILLASPKWAASPSAPQAFAHRLVMLGAGRDSCLEITQPVLGTPEVLSRYPRTREGPERLWH